MSPTLAGSIVNGIISGLAYALLGAAFLTAALLGVPAVAAVPLVLAVWATCVTVAVR